jgi:hypothetical protein
LGSQAENPGSIPGIRIAFFHIKELKMRIKKYGAAGAAAAGGRKKF